MDSLLRTTSVQQARRSREKACTPSVAHAHEVADAAAEQKSKHAPTVRTPCWWNWKVQVRVDWSSGSGSAIYPNA
eukprot:3043468-Prymnesium_polylepis.2